MIRWIVMAAFAVSCAADKPCPAPSRMHGPWKGSALHQAILRNDVDAVKRLLAQGANVNEPDSTGNTPLVSALTPRAALEPAGVVSAAERKIAIQAEQQAQPRIVRMLLDRNADVNATGAQHRTALIQLAAWGYNSAIDTQIAELLLRHGARLNLKDEFGSTALMLAAEKEKPGLVRFLLRNGADSAAKNCHGQTALSLAISGAHNSVIGLLKQ